MKDEEKSENYSDDFFDRVKQAKEQAAQDQQNRNKMRKKKFIADQKRSNAYGDTKKKPKLIVKNKMTKMSNSIEKKVPTEDEKYAKVRKLYRKGIKKSLEKKPSQIDQAIKTGGNKVRKILGN